MKNKTLATLLIIELMSQAWNTLRLCIIINVQEIPKL